jgi:hypothetical protein
VAPPLIAARPALAAVSSVKMICSIVRFSGAV